MKRIQNPVKLKHAIESLPVDQIFSRDYSDCFELFEYEKDEFIMHEGQINDFLFFVLNGTVRCFSYAVNGKVQFINYLHHAQSIGLVGSIWRKPAISNIQATETCRCLALSLVRYRDELMNDNKFLRYLSFQLGDILQNSNRRLQVIQCTSAESKLASVILGSVSDDGLCRLNLTLTAEVVGTTYRHILRMLSRLCANEIIEKKGKAYRIKDSVYLSMCSEESYEYIINERYGISGLPPEPSRLP